MILDDIYTYLVANVTVTGYDVYKAYMPDNSDKCIGIFETGGYGDSLKDTYSDIRYTSFQIIVRAADYATARTKSEEIRNALNTTSVTNYPLIIAAEVLPIGRDEKERSRFSINFRAIKEN